MDVRRAICAPTRRPSSRPVNDGCVCGRQVLIVGVVGANGSRFDARDLRGRFGPDLVGEHWRLRHKSAGHAAGINGAGSLFCVLVVATVFACSE